jgi:hypothetical protein
MNSMTTIARDPNVTDWEPRLTLNGDIVVLEWFDGRTEFGLADLLWLIRVGGPAILAAAAGEEDTPA